MADLESEEKPQSARDTLALDQRTAEKVFSSPGVDFGIELPPDFPPQMRALGQIYDVIQRWLHGDNRRGERYYPTTEDVLSDLQIHKRSINDKVPMPTEEEFGRYLRLLASSQPPFIHFLRELHMGPSRLEVQSMYTAPTDKHPDKVIVGYQAALRNSSNVLKDILYGSVLYSDWEERVKTLKTLEDLELRRSRVDYFLRQLYVTDSSIPQTDFDERLRLKKINENINRYIYRPLIQQLYRDKMVVSFSCKEARAAGVAGLEKYSDILLFNNPEQLQKRYFSLRAVLDSHLCWDFMDRGQLEDLRARKDRDEIDADEFYAAVAALVLAELYRGETANTDLLDLALEVQKLSEWNRAYEKKHRENEEKNALQSMIERVRQHGDLVRVNPRRKTAFPEQYLKMVLTGKIPALLWATEPPARLERGTEPHPQDYEFIFLLYRDRTVTGTAIQSALKLYDEGDDPYLVLLLDRLLMLDELPPNELKKFVPPVYLEQLKKAIQRSYARHLPWLVRFWYSLTSTEITEDTVRKIKQRMKAQSDKEHEAVRRGAEIQEKKSARKQVKSVARERVQEEDRVSHALKATTKLIDKHWAQGHFPTRDDIVDLAPEDQRDQVTKVLGLVDAGAASVRAIRKIQLPSSTNVFASEEYLKEHQTEIVKLCERHSNAEHVAVSEGVERTLQDPTRKRAQIQYSPEDYKAVLRQVQTF